MDGYLLTCGEGEADGYLLTCGEERRLVTYWPVVRGGDEWLPTDLW